MSSQGSSEGQGLDLAPGFQCPPGTRWHPACLPLLGREGWAGRSPWPPGIRAQGHASSDWTPWVTDAPTLGSLTVPRAGQQRRGGHLHRARLCSCLCAPPWRPFGKTPRPTAAILEESGGHLPPSTHRPDGPIPSQLGLTAPPPLQGSS